MYEVEPRYIIDNHLCKFSKNIKPLSFLEKVDYAVVVEVPAKIIRFRYISEQINALNKIEWWNWSDEQIGERYEDFYLPIEQFIEKYS